MEKKQEVRMDLKKIFLSPPDTRKEKITLIAMMVVTFMIFFGPLTFTEVSPVRAVVVSALPCISLSWGWLVLLRSLFRKKDFCKKEERKR